MDLANVSNTTRRPFDIVRAKLSASFLDHRDSYDFIEFSSFLEEF